MMNWVQIQNILNTLKLNQGTTPDLSAYAKISQLPDLSGYTLSKNLPDFTAFALKSSVPDLTPYALKTQLPDLTPFALKTQIPAVPAATAAAPPAEATIGAAGDPKTYAAGDHQHPRISQTINGVLDSTGSKTINFTTPYAMPPGVSLMSVGASGPVMWDVTWIMTNNLYSGMTIKGYRGQKLPAVLTLLTQLLNFDPFGGVVSGIGFTGFIIKSSVVAT